MQKRSDSRRTAAPLLCQLKEIALFCHLPIIDYRFVLFFALSFHDKINQQVPLRLRIMQQAALLALKTGVLGALYGIGIPVRKIQGVDTMKQKFSGAKVLTIYLIILFILATGILIRSFYIRISVYNQEIENTVYSKHYALITGDDDQEFWTQVYESAREEAAENDAYLEWFGRNLSSEYSLNDLAIIAMHSGVDGIILQASEEEGTLEMIDEIVNAGIPVVTALSDCPESVRQAYVGVNNYDIGLLYGQKVVSMVLKQFKKNIRILVVINGDRISSSQNLILLGMREAISKGLPPGYYVNIETELINQEGTYATEEYFNSFFVSRKDLPEVLICLDEKETRCSYRSAVDHNRVGELDMIGYYYSKDILRAVEKEILSCTLSVDAEEIGRSTVDALADFEEYGYTNSYKAVSVKLIDPQEASEILKEEETGDDVEWED